MVNKRINKLLATTMTTAMLIMPLANTAHAMENENSTLFSINDNVNISSDDNVPIGTEVVVTDAEMEKTLRDAGVSEDILQTAYHDKGKMLRASYTEGVNKCVKVTGGYNVYLSKNTLNAMITGGKAAANSAVGKLIPGGWGIAAAALSAIILSNVNNVTCGKIFKVRERSRIIGAAGEIKEWYVASVTNQ